MFAIVSRWCPHAYATRHRERSHAAAIAWGRSLADRGINIVRVPISTQLLLDWKAGQAAVPSGVNTFANPELVGKTTLQAFDAFLALCQQFGIKVMLGVHSAEADNSGHIYPVWWKGTVPLLGRLRRVPQRREGRHRHRTDLCGQRTARQHHLHLFGAGR